MTVQSTTPTTVLARCPCGAKLAGDAEAVKTHRIVPPYIPRVYVPREADARYLDDIQLFELHHRRCA